MTTILAIETATDLVGCAVGGSVAGGGPTEERTTVKASIIARSERSHGEILAPMIQSVLEEAKVTFSELDAIAVDCGPGRFTGLRVGIATAQALAFANSIPVITTTSTELLAFGARRFTGNIVPVVDARRGEAFFAVYRSAEGQIAEVKPACVVSPEQLYQELCRLEGPSLILGDFDFEPLSELVVGSGAESSPDSAASYCENRPSPSSMVILACEKAAVGKLKEPQDVRPEYIRPPDINLPLPNPPNSDLPTSNISTSATP